MTTPLTLDASGVRCDFDAHGCSTSMGGRGGFDLHHEWPESLGGPADGKLLTLCPNHHRRQHAFIRHLVETEGKASWDVAKRYTYDERLAAQTAYAAWVAAGSPPIKSWPAPAARAT